MLYRLTNDLITATTALCDRLGRTRLIFDRDEPTQVYLKRYYLIGTKNTRWLPVLCLHRFLRSDQGHLHDHPWAFFSLVLRGGYYETRPDGQGGFRIRWRGRGSLVWRWARDLHRVELFPDSPYGTPSHRDYRDPVYTLVLMMPRFREWGFAEFDAQGITTWWRWDTYLDHRAKHPPAEDPLMEQVIARSEQLHVQNTPQRWETA